MNVSIYVPASFEGEMIELKSKYDRGIWARRVCFDILAPGLGEKVAWKLFMGEKLDAREAAYKQTFGGEMFDASTALEARMRVCLNYLEGTETDVQLVEKLGIEDAHFMARCRAKWGR